MDRPGLKLSRENAGQENKFRCEKGARIDLAEGFIRKFIGKSKRYS